MRRILHAAEHPQGPLLPPDIPPEDGSVACAPFRPHNPLNPSCDPLQVAEIPSAADCGDREEQLRAYLSAQENPYREIDRLMTILAKDHVILEIGCGSCETALQIALANPDWGVVATDKFDWTEPLYGCSYYRRIAEDFRLRHLPVQACTPDNLVLLRTDAGILSYIPDQRVDSILMINSEPVVGQFVMDLLCHQGMYRKIKPGDRQIVVVPYSRELGVIASGGYEFDHPEDWSRGLGYIMSSGLSFRKGERLQWGVDLCQSSPYSPHSTQSDVYIFGNTYPLKRGPSPRAPVRRAFR